MEFNNEIIDGQSTVADNLAKSNRNFMLLKEILGSGATSQDIQSMLNTISQTYVKTTDIVNSLNSTDTNKPVSALQAKNLKQDITGLTNQLQQLNQNVSSLTQNVSNLSQQLNQKIGSLTQQLNNKVGKYSTIINNNTDLHSLPSGKYYIETSGMSTTKNFPYDTNEYFKAYIDIIAMNAESEQNSNAHKLIIMNFAMPRIEIYHQHFNWTNWGVWAKVSA